MASESVVAVDVAAMMRPPLLRSECSREAEV